MRRDGHNPFFDGIRRMIQNLFIDLDDTVWSFSENACDTFREMYDRYRFDRYFTSFEEFYTIYKKRNKELWDDYAHQKVTKEQLNDERFAFPLLQKGVDDFELVKAYRGDFFKEIVLKKKVMPHTHEALTYLAGKYNLYILSNGFRELQETKMRSAGVEGYFKQVILSEDIGVHKPYPAIFEYAMKETGSLPENSMMIGDNWEVDVEGAKNVGMKEVFYNALHWKEFPFEPYFVLNDWNEVMDRL